MTDRPRLMTVSQQERRHDPSAESDGVKWLALLLRDAFLVITRGIEARYGIGDKRVCPRCGHRHS